MPDQKEARWQQLCALADDTRQQHNVPGVVLGILHDGRVRTAGFGVTNVDHPLEVTDETLFQIGSITKTYTGTLLMKMAEEGQIDLDATVRTYVPDFKVADEETSARATIRHLLTHTGGWSGDYFTDTGQGDDAAARQSRFARRRRAAGPRRPAQNGPYGNHSAPGWLSWLAARRAPAAQTRRLKLVGRGRRGLLSSGRRAPGL